MSTLDHEKKQPSCVITRPDPVTTPQSLYERLRAPKFGQYPYEKCSLGDAMSVVNEAMREYWKPRFLMDDRNKVAFEFMNHSAVLQTIRQEDIDWDSLRGFPDDVIGRARNLDAWFPTLIRMYRNGVAEVRWMLQPDGRYYQDEDGFGMTDDKEITICGMIDRTGKAVGRFRRK